jgi:group II intron reverse transcriptase/maturase
MQNAETVLGIIHEYGKRRLPLRNIYRLLYNPDLYLRAYARLYANKGATTRGTTSETVDGMSLAKIKRIIDALRYERYRWTPVRRTYIPKKNGKKRPLGMPTWSDKLLQEVLRLILEAYYEPQFSDHSHGFRPERGCHSALCEVKQTWPGTKWFIEGDIKGCFDAIDHTVIMNILREKIQDNRFLRLIEALLQAGYLEEWRYHRTTSGTPQGGIISPMLSNIYLDQLDKYVEQVLLKAYNRKNKRRNNREYERLIITAWRYRKRGKKEEAKQLRKQAQKLPSQDMNDPDFRRLRYVRYADDFLLGFAGSKAEAETIKEHLRVFLQEELKLELSQEKTVITHAQTAAARFLGYEITTYQVNEKMDQRKIRNINGGIELRVPKDVIKKHCATYQKRGKPIQRAEYTYESDFSIVEKYQSKYRGLVQYYLLATNVCHLHKLHGVMRTSLLKTLANKHRTSVMKMVKKYQSEVHTPYGKLKCLQVKVERKEKKPLISRFGGIPLKRQERAVIQDINPHQVVIPRNELVKRLLRDTCELCGSKGNTDIHHIRKLSDYKKPGRKEKPLWAQVMIAMHRKTLVVCEHCHTAIHAGKPISKPKSGMNGLESRVQ